MFLVTIGAKNGTFAVVFTATPTATGTFTNPYNAPTGKCIVDPDNVIGETNEGNNECGPDTVTVTIGGGYAAPALNTWAMLLLALLIGGVSALVLRRRKNRV